MSSGSSVKRGVDFMRAVVKYMANDGSFGTVCLKNINEINQDFPEKQDFSSINKQLQGFLSVPTQIQILEGENGRLQAEFKVLPEHLNSQGGLHGGFTASLVDILTSIALLSKDSHPGVSVDLHVSYLKAAKEGDQIIVNARALRVGRKMAFLECELKDKTTGALIAKGGQTKYVDLADVEDYSRNIS